MSITEKVNKIIENVRPALESDGGGIELVEVLEDEGVAVVNLTGACSGCPMSTMTIKGYVEQAITAEIPEIKEVRVAN